MCAFCSVACIIWEGLIGVEFTKILPWEKLITDHGLGNYAGPTVIGLLVFFSYAIVMNTVVPISLYVSVEVSITNKNVILGYMLLMLQSTKFLKGNSIRPIIFNKLG